MTTNKFYETLISCIYSIIDEDNFEVIRADQSASRPKIPYCSMRILSQVPISHEEYSSADNGDNIDVTSKVSYRTLVSFKFYNGAAMDKAIKARQGFTRESIIDILSVNDIGVLQRKSIRNETTNLESVFEDRAGFDVNFNYIMEDTDTVGSIDEVEASGEYQSNDNSYPITININE